VGRETEQSVILAGEMKKLGVDLIDVSSGALVKGLNTGTTWRARAGQLNVRQTGDLSDFEHRVPETSSLLKLHPPKVSGCPVHRAVFEFSRGAGAQTRLYLFHLPACWHASLRYAASVRLSW
jgi:hypothetical protein